MSETIPTLHPRQVFTIATLTEYLSLKPGTVPREIRLRRLKACKRAGRVWILGRWVLEWLEGGEIHKEELKATANGFHDP